MKNLITLLTLALLTICFTSCNKDDSEDTPVLSHWSNLEPANPNNPYDGVGQLHNEWIEYYVNSCVSGSSVSVKDPVEVIFPLFLKLEGYNANDTIAIVRYNTFRSIADNPSSLAWADNLENYNLRGSVIEIMEKITNALNKVETSNPQPALQDLKNIVVWINSLDLKQEEKMILYYMASVSSYSLAYWITELNNSEFNETPWSRLYDKHLEGSKKPPFWERVKRFIVDIVKDDVQGAGEATAEQIQQGGLSNATFGCAAAGGTVGSIVGMFD